MKFYKGILLMLLGMTICSNAQNDKPILDYANGYVQVKQIDGIWWFIDPDGKKFVSIGVNHIEPHLWLAPYNKQNTLKKYGDDMVTSMGYFDTNTQAAQKWIDHQIEISRDLGFNTFGKHTHPAIDPQLYKDKVYFVISLETAPTAGWIRRKGYGPMPDVFSSYFEKEVDQKISEICQKHRNNRNLIGYVYTDIPNWKEGSAKKKGAMVYPWINDLLALGASSPGKQNWIRHLRERYDDPIAAAKVWGLPISPTYGISWEQMVDLLTWFEPVDKQKADADMVAFMYKIAEQWYKIHYETIKKYDKNHLLLGDKNLLNSYYEWVVPALKKYVDVISVQAYGKWNDEKATYQKIYNSIGKPIFNGDGSYGFADAHQQEWGVKGFRTNAKNYKDVANLYQETLTGMMSEPYLIGWHHCGYLQQWDQAERGDSPRNENGFLDPFENYHKEWTKVVKEVNTKASELHEKARQ